MANTVLVYTSQLTVEKAPLLDPVALNDLATWLCRETNYHDTDPVWNGTQAQDERYDQERQEDGFCHYCRDHAGALLVAFDVRKRDNNS